MHKKRLKEEEYSLQTPREVYTSKVRRGRDDVSENWAIGRNEVNDTGRESGFGEDFEHNVIGKHCGVRWFPQNNIPLKSNSNRAIHTLKFILYIVQHIF